MPEEPEEQEQLPRRAPGPRPSRGGSTEGSVFRPAMTGDGSRESPDAASPRKKGTSREPREATGGPTFLERLFFGSVSTAHRAAFCRQAAAYLEAGVDLLKALGALAKQFQRTALGPVIERIQQSIRRGSSLSEAMARESQAFDPLFLSMMRVAETRGALPEILRRMAVHYEDRQRLYRQARSAMVYPISVLLIAFTIIWLLATFVIPPLVEVLSGMIRGGAANLPLPTRLLLLLSNFMKWIGWWALPLGFVGAVVLGLRFYRTPAGKAFLDRFILYVPVLGMLMRKIDVARFARCMGALLEAGVDMGTSLDLTADVVRLTPYRNAVRSLRPAIVEGEELGEAMAATRRFPADALAYVETGENTGKLPESLGKLADEYEEQVEHLVKNLGQLVQPIIYIILGGFVLFILLAFFLAYIQVIMSLSNGL